MRFLFGQFPFGPDHDRILPFSLDRPLFLSVLGHDLVGRTEVGVIGRRGQRASQRAHGARGAAEGVPALGAMRQTEGRAHGLGEQEGKGVVDKDGFQDLAQAHGLDLDQALAGAFGRIFSFLVYKSKLFAQARRLDHAGHGKRRSDGGDGAYYSFSEDRILGLDMPFQEAGNPFGQFALAETHDASLGEVAQKGLPLEPVLDDGIVVRTGGQAAHDQRRAEHRSEGAGVLRVPFPAEDLGRSNAIRQSRNALAEDEPLRTARELARGLA